ERGERHTRLIDRPRTPLSCVPRSRQRGSVAEVAAAREDHGYAGSLDGGDDLRVALRAAGLDDRGDPRVERELRAVREREEPVGGEDAAAEVVPVLACLVEGDPNGVDTAHL